MGEMSSEDSFDYEDPDADLYDDTDQNIDSAMREDNR